MEYLEGETLEARIQKGPLPAREALQYAVQITAALDAAHRRGIVHRDLKPANVMLGRTGVKLLDFGLAKTQAVAGTEGETLAITVENTIVGTLQYMSPEQLEGKEADAAATSSLAASFCTRCSPVAGEHKVGELIQMGKKVVRSNKAGHRVGKGRHLNFSFLGSRAAKSIAPRIGNPGLQFRAGVESSAQVLKPPVEESQGRSCRR